ncbi:MAG: ABC transporter ATP-binding protein [Exilispira sp.]|nr:ABC transporter ATP-binding protein [Exilispira sp.]
MTLLELKDVTLEKEGKYLLKNLDMEIWAGYVHAIVGPNGAGKSTLAHTIMGLSGYRQISGDIIFEGKSIKEYSIDERAKLGLTLVFQEPARFEGIKVSDFILAGSKEKKVEVVENALNKVGLNPQIYKDRAVDKTLSGGERKRIELASVYAMNPRLVLMDEPDSGVDLDSLKYIFDIIKDIKNRGSTVVLVTHSPTVLKQADHAFLICGGKIVDKGTMHKMFEYFSGKCKPCAHVGNPDENEMSKNIT